LLNKLGRLNRPQCSAERALSAAHRMLKALWKDQSKAYSELCCSWFWVTTYNEAEAPYIY